MKNFMSKRIPFNHYKKITIKKTYILIEILLFFIHLLRNMRKRIKQYIAVVLLLMLQIIGSFDLYAAIHFPCCSSNVQQTTLLHKIDTSVSFERIPVAFHKNLSEVLENGDSSLINFPFSAASFTTLLIQFLYYTILPEVRPVLYGFVPPQDVHPAGRYLLFSNFRI